MDAAKAGPDRADPGRARARASRRSPQKPSIDISAFPIVDAPHSEASAAEAVALVREGKAEALMKGSLHTDELMGAVVKRETGLRTARRISHCFVMDVPGHPDALIITDAAVNIAPTLEDKVHIVQNAIDLAHALGVDRGAGGGPLGDGDGQSRTCRRRSRPPRCARWPTAGRSPAALLDGPLALDNAISPEAAKIKKIDSPVAGRANVLVVPDLEAGNMLAKSLTFLAGADAAGIVLGARVPIILTSRADSRDDAARLLRRGGAGRQGAARRAQRRWVMPWPTRFSSSTPARRASSSRLFTRRPTRSSSTLRGQIEGLYTAPRFVAQGR